MFSFLQEDIFHYASHRESNSANFFPLTWKKTVSGNEYAKWEVKRHYNRQFPGKSFNAKASKLDIIGQFQQFCFQIRQERHKAFA